MKEDNVIIPKQSEEIITENTKEVTEDIILESSEVKSEEKTKKTRAKKGTKKNTKKADTDNDIKEKSTIDTDSDTKEKSKIKNEEYYIKVQYPNSFSHSDEVYLKITADDKTNFKDSKEIYHQMKDVYKNEASRISLIGISKDKEANVLHYKNLKQKDIDKNIHTNLQQIISLKSEIVTQLNDLEKELAYLHEQKENIETIIKNADYSSIEQTEWIPNELIRLKYILSKIEAYNNIINHLKPVINNADLFSEIEGVLPEIYA